MSARTLTVALWAFVLVLSWGGPAAAQRSVTTPAPAPAPSATTPQLLPPPDLSSFLGRRITRVDVVLDDSTWTDVTIPPIRTVRAGLDFVPALARQLLDEVLASGSFARGRVSVLEDAGGVRLLARVVPRKLIESLRVDLHGASLAEDELLRDADLATGGELVAKDLPEQQARIEAFFASRGYPSAIVTITTRPTDSVQKVTVLVDVLPGLPFALTHRRFLVSGAPPRAVDSVVHTYAVKTGDRMDQATLDAADLALANRLRALGYQRALVGHDLVVNGATSTLEVRIDTGPLFEPRYEGNEHFDADALDGALDLVNEADRTGGHLAQKLRIFYIKHGFLDAEVTVEPRGLAPSGAVQVQAKVVTLVFHIAEHERVSVVSRLYPCLKTADIKHLSEAPGSASAIGTEIDSFLEEELPGQDLIKNPHPQGLDDLIRGLSPTPRGEPPVPIDLDPDATFEADTYERALLHVQELYRNEGYLHAQVGPVQLVRRRCDPRSPADRCIPVPLPREPVDACTYDATNLPLPVPPIDPAISCTPDPGHGLFCEPRLSLRIPIKLGPQSILYDLAFYGARSIAEKALATAAALTLGEPANALKLDEARRRIADAYKEDGFAYVDVKYTLDASLDHTRARARFDIIEGKRVMVRQIIIRGNDRTSTQVIRKRVALELGKPYRTSDVRKTEERVATLNVFTSVNVSLEDAYVPQENKAVIVTVIERTPQYISAQPGISSGEGLRLALEYGHRNLFGDAISVSVRLQASYLPDFLILDPQVRQNYDTAFGYPAFGQRLAQRDTVTLAFPDIGLGPLFRATVDGLYVRDLERDFALSKGALIVTQFYKPIRQLQMSIAPDVELNDSTVFGSTTVEQYLEQQAASNQGNADLGRLLRVPTGLSDAAAQRYVVTWDRRDTPFNAHRGTLVAAGIEHVDWGSLESLDKRCPQAPRPVYNRLLNTAANNGLGTTYNVASPTNPCEPSAGHFFRLTQTVAGYIPLTKKITLAGELRLGVNVQTVANSSTYPDRLFFMGGIESMRGYLQDTLMPQDQADRIAQSFSKPASDPSKFTQADVPLRGGNLMVNPRLELRIPVVGPLETVVFFDSGNMWSDATYPFKHGFPLRTSSGVGAGLQTPVGPILVGYGLNLSRLFATNSIDPRRTYEDLGAFYFAIGLF